MSTEEEKGVHGRAEEFLQIFKKGAEFTQELMKENERLRFRVLQLEEPPRDGGSGKLSSEEIGKLQKRIEELGAGKGGDSGAHQEG